MCYTTDTTNSGRNTTNNSRNTNDTVNNTNDSVNSGRTTTDTINNGRNTAENQKFSRPGKHEAHKLTTRLAVTKMVVTKM